MIMSAAATVNFMTQKMIVEFEEGKEPGTVMKDVLKACKKVEPDCEIALWFLADQVEMDSVIFNRKDTWTDTNGVEWNQKVK